MMRKKKKYKKDTPTHMHTNTHTHPPLIHTEAVLGIGFYGLGFNPIREWLLLQLLCHYCTKVSCMQVTIVDLSVCSWVGGYVSYLVGLRVPCSSTNVSQ